MMKSPKTPCSCAAIPYPYRPSAVCSCTSACLDPDQHVQTLNPPFLLAQQALDPFVHSWPATFPLDALYRAREQRLRRVICRLRKNLHSLEHRCCPVQSHLTRLGKRRIEPWCVEVEEGNDENEQE
jgi:hypothetical protein